MYDYAGANEIELNDTGLLHANWLVYEHNVPFYISLCDNK